MSDQERSLALLGVRALQARLREGAIAPVDLLQAQFARTARWEPRLRAYLTLDREGAVAAAEAAVHGPSKPLFGLTLGIKDLFDVRGLKTTGGSAAYGDAPAASDAFVVARARAAGAVITGKLNTEELAFGVISAPTRNPFDLSHIPGGSSGGNAAALAAGMITLAIGSDTAGSIRIPAALCGVMGLKPSAGRVSRQGAMALSYTLDSVGPMARDVDGLRALLAVIEGWDPDDPLSLPALPGPLPETRRLGVPRTWIEGVAQREIADRFSEVLSLLERLGYALVDLDWPKPEAFIDLQMRIRGPETVHVHEAALKDRPERFGPGLVARIQAGAGSSARDYVDALQARHALTRRLEREMAQAGIDGLVLPTTPAPAPLAGQDAILLRDGRERTVRQALILYTAPYNVTGWPAVSLPMGLQGDGLPIGLQVVGRRFEDARLLARAEEIAQALPAADYPEPPR